MRHRAAVHRLPTIAMLFGALALGLPACDDSGTGPDDDVPRMVTLTLDAVGDFDETVYNIQCLDQPFPPSNLVATCPVIDFEGRDYWALSYTDNRSAMAIHAFNDAGVATGILERTGARYPYAVEVDEEAETVTFRGQSDLTLTFTWEELLALR